MGTGSNGDRQGVTLQPRGLPGKADGELGRGAKVSRDAIRPVDPELFREFERTIEALEAECEAKRTAYYDAIAASDAGRHDEQLAGFLVKVSFDNWHAMRVLIAEVARLEAKWHQENAMRKTLNSERLFNADLI